MSTQTTQDKALPAAVNEVRIVGRVSGVPQVTRLPSGDELVTFRISVERDPRAGAGRQKVDSLPCCAWVARVRRSARGWRAGDIVEVAGAIRCRFFQSARGLGSRVEVEVVSARIIRRAPGA